MSAQSLLQPEKKPEKKRYGHLSGGCVIVITTGKKRYCRLSGGCAIVITTGRKKETVFCLAGARSLLRTENKKVPVVCLACARSLLRPENKKSSSCLSGGCAIAITSGKKKRYSRLSLVAIIIFVLVQLELNLIQIH